MIRLRAHHLLCSLTFTGRGYSRAFERDFKEVIERIRQDETIEIVSGPDEICVSVKECAGSHCYEDRIAERDRLALLDISVSLGITLDVGSVIKPRDLFHERFRHAYKEREVRSACFDCQWTDVCDTVVRNKFAKAQLKYPLVE